MHSLKARLAAGKGVGAAYGGVGGPHLLTSVFTADLVWLRSLMFHSGLTAGIHSLNQNLSALTSCRLLLSKYNKTKIYKEEETGDSRLANKDKTHSIQIISL